MTSRPLYRSAFSLIELLTVIAIIGVLAGIMIPVIGKVRDNARSTQCISNLRAMSSAVLLHAGDHQGRLPESFRSAGGAVYLTEIIAPYLAGGIENADNSDKAGHRRRVAELVRCPAGKKAPIGPNDTLSTYSANPQLMPDRSTSAYANVALTPVVAITRPGQVIMLADGGQHGEGNASLTHAWPSLRGAIFAAADGGGSMNWPGNADAAHANLTAHAESDSVNAFFRYRHSGDKAVNCAFADGSVRSFRKGEMKNRNVSIAY